MAENRAELTRKEEMEEPYLYLDVAVISDESFRHHSGFDLTSADLAPSNPAAPTIYRVFRTSKFGRFAQRIARERKLKSEQIRFWEMVNRQNKTIRPDRPLLNYDSTFEEILGKNFRGGKLYMWVEVMDMAEEGKISWPGRQGWNCSVLLFLKHVDGLNQTVTGIGHVYVRKNDKIGSLSSHIIKTMNWPAGTQLLFFEVMSEIKCECPKTNGIPTGNQAEDDRTNDIRTNIFRVGDSGWRCHSLSQGYELKKNPTPISPKPTCNTTFALPLTLTHLSCHQIASMRTSNLRARAKHQKERHGERFYVFKGVL